jgi:hypothetical protein
VEEARRASLTEDEIVGGSCRVLEILRYIWRMFRDRPVCYVPASKPSMRE